MNKTVKNVAFSEQFGPVISSSQRKLSVMQSTGWMEKNMVQKSTFYPQMLNKMSHQWVGRGDSSFLGFFWISDLITAKCPLPHHLKLFMENFDIVHYFAVYRKVTVSF